MPVLYSRLPRVTRLILGCSRYGATLAGADLEPFLSFAKLERVRIFAKDTFDAAAIARLRKARPQLRLEVFQPGF